MTDQIGEARPDMTPGQGNIVSAPAGVDWMSGHMIIPAENYATISSGLHFLEGYVGGMDESPHRQQILKKLDEAIAALDPHEWRGSV